MSNGQLDVVIPVFNEIEIVEQLHRRVVAACRDTGLSFRIIYVDDGSSDGTPQWLVRNAVETQSQFLGSVNLLQLSRNFGQPAAIQAGLEHSDADCCVLMDGDLQDPPELIPEMVSRWKDGDEV